MNAFKFCFIRVSDSATVWSLISDINRDPCNQKSLDYSKNFFFFQFEKTQIKHYGDVQPLRMSFNNSLREMKNELTRMWFSLNSTGKRLQEQITASWLSMWSAVNATQLELVNKVSRFASCSENYFIPIHLISFQFTPSHSIPLHSILFQSIIFFSILSSSSRSH